MSLDKNEKKRSMFDIWEMIIKISKLCNIAHDHEDEYAKSLILRAF